MFRNVCCVAMVVGLVGCTATSPIDPKSTPVPGGVRPIATIYGAYPREQKETVTLDHGHYAELEVLREISLHWSVGLAAGHFRIGTRDPYFDMPLEPMEGVPILAKFERGGYSRSGLMRYYFDMALGYMFYGEPSNPAFLPLVPDDGLVATSSIGMEILGRQGLDLRLEWGYMWEFDKRYDQWLGGLGLAYGF